ncbi:hypothetical protein [Haladaptatus sp. DYF46]|uniref:hypothetical protein n=1 Tax=Haladaptatus sp. DYF46 TaxID=2886041 RepID=UPI001E42485B|nr:hypothetical protein [Haladaptatus sp. DYF46]
MKALVAIVVVGIALLGVGSLLVEDSPYDGNTVSERNPVVPERPATLDGAAARKYLIDYERIRLFNDLLASRGHTLDTNDDVRADCTAVSTTETASDRFRVRLSCHGRIVDTNRLVQPTDFRYTVTYSITEDSLEERALHGYPYESRDELHERPS